MKLTLLHYKIITPMENQTELISHLESKNLPVFAVVETGDTVEIFTAFERNEEVELNELKEKFSPFKAEALGNGVVDWELEWQTHSKYYENGFLKIQPIDFGKSGPEIIMLPGPGFGDLSHRTTELTLKLMSKLPLQGAFCIDIGSGSGILSLAAACWGAKKVIALDIDPEAVSHTKENVKLNHFDSIIEAHLTPFEGLLDCLQNEKILFVFMNMIESEQKTAFRQAQIEKLKGLEIILVTSGILLKDKTKYIQSQMKAGFKLQESLDNEGWLAGVFKN